MTDSSRFVWVVGSSGVGKATLIRSLAEGRPDGLRERFEVAGPLRLMGPSIDRGWLDPLPVEEVVEMEAAVSTVIKWQGTIPTADIQEIALRRPDASHRIVLLFRNVEIVLGQLVARDKHRDTFDWADRGTPYLIETEEKVRSLFLGIRNPSLPVSAYDASDGLEGVYREDSSYLE
jgi:hypothetical protein